MKKLTLLLTISLIALFTTNAFGSKKDHKTSNNTNTPYSVNISNGIETKVYISNNDETGELQTRTVYMTDLSGKRLGTIIYRWDSSIGWIQDLKTEYQYNQNNELSKIIKSKWDTNSSEWKNKLEQNIKTH